MTLYIMSEAAETVSCHWLVTHYSAVCSIYRLKAMLWISCANWTVG